jgi:3',5'-nucleoside bisphosphate phosphatase
MKRYIADLHIHTSLSPCGNRGMTPALIINKALKKGVHILGITDHNSTRQAFTVKKIGKEKGIFVLCGAEATSREGIHCLALFKDDEKVLDFQKFLDEYLIRIKNNSTRFGEQLLIDENDKIIEVQDDFLGSSLNVSIFELGKKVHSLNGLFIPSHINRPHNSILSVFGKIPDNIKADALEIDCKYLDSSPLDKNPEINSYCLIRNSDAHHPEGIGSFPSAFNLETLSFDEIRMAINQVNGRGIEIDF